MLTYGFYNSKGNDRVYDAIQMSSIFDGIIRDGVFMHYRDRFRVEPISGLKVRVGAGRAWFNHTWTLNDTPIEVDVPPAESLLNRIDAIVLEVNGMDTVRANSIKVIKGEPATEPKKPTLIKSAYVNQYAFAYISVKKGATSLTSSDIEFVVGQGDTPYVTSPLESINIEDMVRRWENQWDDWTKQEKSIYTNWFSTAKQQITNWTDEQKRDFLSWYDGVKLVINDNAAGVLNGRIDELQTIIERVSPIINNINKYSEIRIPVSSWVLNASSGLYDASISVDGMTSDSTPFIDILYKTSTKDLMEPEKENYALIEKCITSYNRLLFSASDKPSADIWVKVKGV